jgi:hypothetical protein
MNEEPKIRQPKTKQSGDWEASQQALSYAKSALFGLHDTEVWTLAQRLDAVMKAQVEQFIAEIRK